MKNNDEVQAINLESLRAMPLPRYSDDANKTDYGRLVIIAGSRRLVGAALLCAQAALRCGVGTVRLAAPASIAVPLGIHAPEVMMLPLSETARGTIARAAVDEIMETLSQTNAVVLGPGMDEDDETHEAARVLAARIELPILLDATAISAVGDDMKALGVARGPRILTPHEGEMQRLFPSATDDDYRGEARLNLAREYSRASGATLVLKGRETLIASPEGTLLKNSAGTRGLGRGGSGDTLAGIIGSLMAQGMEVPHAAAWGVHLHALAGEAAAKDLGDDSMLARDTVAKLPGVLRYLRRQCAPENEASRSGLRP
jgi:hydroxyethylthiazole kinase-like uncharacterized protein yjeF